MEPRELRRCEVGLRRTSMIALTANAYASDREAWLAAGMDDYLVKWIGLKNLGEALARWAEASVETRARFLSRRHAFGASNACARSFQVT